MTALLGPIERDSVTTLTRGASLDLATLTAAVAIGIRLGIEVVPGWVPEAPGEVAIFAYEGNWVEWKSLICDLCAAAGVEVPMLDLRFPDEPMVEVVEKRAVDRDRTYWGPYEEADKVAAREAGRNPLPTTPAMAAGIADHVFSVGAIVSLIEARERPDSN